MGFLRALASKSLGPITGPPGTVQRELINAWTALNDASQNADPDGAHQAHLRLLALGRLYAPEVFAAHLDMLVAMETGQPVVKGSPWRERFKVAVYLASKPPYTLADPAQIATEMSTIDSEMRAGTFGG